MAKTYKGTKYSDRFFGTAEDDSFFGFEGNDRFYGSAGKDEYYGGSGIDTVDYRFSTSGVYVNLYSSVGKAGDALGDTYDSIEHVIGTNYNDTLIGDNAANTLNGRNGDDRLYGGNGNDNLVGGNGVDRLYGGGHNDTLNGGNDNDYLYGGSGNDVLQGGRGADYIHGGWGTDTVSYYSSYAGVTVNLGSGTATNGDAYGDTIRYVENITGSYWYSDSLTGNAGNNVIDGLRGDDLIYGTSGNDTIIGGLGFDTLDYRLIGNTNGVEVDLTQGRVDKGSDGLDTVSSIEEVYGTNYGDSFIGNAGANTFEGLNGDDTFHADAGSDTYFGGAGIDTVTYASSAAAVSVNLATRSGSGGSAQGDYVGEIENLIGTLYDDTLTGNGSDNKLRGDFGDDTLRGGTGNDMLAGGFGADELHGDAGFDTAIYLHDYIAVDLAAGTGGTVQNPDEIDSEAEGDTLTGIEAVTTYGVNVSVSGDAGNNVFNIHGQGNFDGRDGDDLFNIDATPHGGFFVNNSPCTVDAVPDPEFGNNINGGAGTDTIDYSKAAGTDYFYGRPGFEIDLADGEARNLGNPEAVPHTLNNIENVTGSTAADIIRGDNNDNVLDGAAGDDTLIGGGGNDTLTGGSRADIFVFVNRQNDNDQDVITDFEIGIDKIDFSDNANFIDDFQEFQQFSQQVGSDVVIDTGAGSVTLQNVQRADITVDDFLF